MYESPFILFLHIPKTAGTTLNKIIENQYGPNRCFKIDGARIRESLETFANYPDKQKREIRILMGHMGFGQHRLVKEPFTYITILRDPIDRVISHYYFVLRKRDHYLHQRVVSQDVSLKEYVSGGFSTELDNGQTRLICGPPYEEFGKCSDETLARAKKNLKEYFSVVGLFERFEETLKLLKATFKWTSASCVRENVTTNRPTKREIPEDAYEIIKEYNRLDIELYKYAEEIFERLVTKHGIGI